MAKTANLIGKTYSRWTVIDTAPSRVRGNGRNRSYWKCRCSCGVESEIAATHLIGLKTQSCGCYNSDVARTIHVTHGHNKNLKRSPTLSSYRGILDRCYQPTHKHWKHYGGRGIIVCERWKTSFEKFVEDMGLRPPGSSIDRINTSIGYSKENCRWATAKQQARNKTNNRLLTLDGKTMCTADWADCLGIPQGTLNQRLSKGWSVERTLTQSVRKPR